jgi:type VI protein secretion system component VasF
MHPGSPHSDSPGHHHVRGPIDTSYRLVIRTVLWLIVGAVLVGFVLWWYLT